MTTNLENSAVARGLEKITFLSNPKKRKCQRMFKLPHNYTHLTHQQSNTENSLSQALTVYEPRTARYSSWIQKRWRNKRSNCQHPQDPQKSKRIQEKYICFIDYTKALNCVNHNKLENSERDGNTRQPDLPPEKSVCRSRSNSQNWTWNNRLVPNRKRSTSSLYIVTLLI